MQFSDCQTQVESYFQAIKTWKMAIDKLLAAEEELNKQRELFFKQLMEESRGSGNELMQVLRKADFLVNNLEDLQATDSEEFDVRLPDFTKLFESVQTTLVDPSRCHILAGLDIRKLGPASLRLCTLGERGLLRLTGLLTLPGEDYSPTGKRPRNSYMTDLDGLCQGGPDREKYPKTTRTRLVKRPKNKKEVWNSLVRASSSEQPMEEKKEEDKCLLQVFMHIQCSVFVLLQMNVNHG